MDAPYFLFRFSMGGVSIELLLPSPHQVEFAGLGYAQICSAALSLPP